MKKFISSTTGLIFLAVTSLIPLIISTIYVFSEINTLSSISSRIDDLQKKSENQRLQRQYEETTLSKISSSSQEYTKNFIESLSFLNAEKQKWTLFTEQDDISDPIRQRCCFLDTSNYLRFETIDTKINKLLKESILKQTSPIEINDEDLKMLLCYIEGINIHPYVQPPCAPQFLIQSFVLEKHLTPLLREKTYQVHLKLIERSSL